MLDRVRHSGRKQAAALVATVAVTLAAGCSTQSPTAPAAPAPDLAVEERARAALQPLKQNLLAELSGAMERGPVEALDVCRLRAPEIAAGLSRDGIRVGRTSHRPRNPRNAPEPWMEPLLDAYLDDPAEREPRTIEIDAATVGYVEPIYVKPLCLTCHGTALDADVEAKLTELYPEDRATGFTTGDFRGMFWVTLPARAASPES